MNILNLLSHNIRNGSRTKTPLDLVPLADGYRGELHHKSELCISCGTCVYVCSCTAITIDEKDEFTEVWNYTEDLCTFCGRCVDACPTDALSFNKVSPEPVSERSQHYQHHEIKLAACKRCGEPVHVLPESFKSKLLKDEQTSKEMAAKLELCDRCRQIVVVQNLKSSMKE